MSLDPIDYIEIMDEKGYSQSEILEAVNTYYKNKVNEILKDINEQLKRINIRIKLGNYTTQDLQLLMDETQN